MGLRSKLKKLARFIPDKMYLKMKFRIQMGEKLNLKDPKTLNAKLQWLKLYNRNPQYTMMVDKYEVRDYVAKVLGQEYLIPLLGVWEDPEQIDFDALPEQFVLKCTHNSGLGMYICKDKTKMDVQKVKNNLRKGLAQNYYLSEREWPYKNVKPRIVAEKFMTDYPGATEFTDYKFFCFGDYVDCVMCCYDRNTGNVKFHFFEEDWTFKRYTIEDGDLPEDFTKPKPANMDEMFAVARKLAKEVDAPFVRVDLYNSDGQIYFGELTFFPDSGFDNTITPESDRYFGDLIKLPAKRK